MFKHSLRNSTENRIIMRFYGNINNILPNKMTAIWVVERICALFLLSLIYLLRLFAWWVAAQRRSLLFVHLFIRNCNLLILSFKNTFLRRKIEFDDRASVWTGESKTNQMPAAAAAGFSFNCKRSQLMSKPASENSALLLHFQRDRSARCTRNCSRSMHIKLFVASSNCH